MRVHKCNIGTTVLAFTSGYLVGLILTTIIMNSHDKDKNLPSNITKHQILPEPVTETTIVTAPVSRLRPASQPLVVLIFSGPIATARRHAVRKTWLQMASSLNITAKFLIGTDGLNSSVMKNLTTENEEFNDMLLFPDVHDSFHNLTLKLLKGILWAQSNVYFDYLMKADDDTYVRLDMALAGVSDIKVEYKNRVHWGYFKGNALPETEGKYEEHNWLKCPNYFPYALGACYILSKPVVSMMVRFSDKLVTGYNNDDVSVGAWLAPYDIVRIHDLRFTFREYAPACKQDFIASHVHTVTSLHKQYGRLGNTKKKLCEWRSEGEKRYVYNWNVSPLECCKLEKNIQLKSFGLTHSGFSRNNTLKYFN